MVTHQKNIKSIRTSYTNSTTLRSFSFHSFWNKKRVQRVILLFCLVFFHEILEARFHNLIKKLFIIFILIIIFSTFCSLLLIVAKIICLFDGFTLNPLSLSRIHFEFTISFANSLWIYYLFREFTLNLLSFSRIHFEFTIFFANLLWITLRNHNGCFIFGEFLKIIQ